MRARAVRPGRDDDEVGAAVPGREDRVGDVGADLTLGAAGPQPLPHLGMHRIDRGRRAAQRLDLLRPTCGCAARAAPAPRRPARARDGHVRSASERAAHIRSSTATRPRVAGTSAGQRRDRVVGLRPADDRHVEVGSDARLDERNLQHRREQVRRPVRTDDQAGDPLGLRVAVVAGQIAKVRARRDSSAVRSRARSASRTRSRRCPMSVAMAAG